ncbi:hypothetical protein PMKS-003513 [Pichia membranifaciens]|uniref:Uncharacterized protein n=1 Tax=Pichia membranifaciens TaxID=4926 RepID=A0A1Q2YKD7_9ASCO|nr:hypothetical protein PMKS-003513 [Pichia membranifaciens]
MPELDQEKLESLKQELAKFKKGEKVEKRSRTTALGKLFDGITKKIQGYQAESDVISFLYSRFGPHEGHADSTARRKYVIDKLLNYLKEINLLSAKKKDSNMISIPLYDIRVVGELTNIIIIHGIYAIMPSDILLPLEKRKLKNFKVPTAYTKINLNFGIPILKDVLFTFTEIFESESDLKDLILVGTGFTDALSIAIYFTVYTEPTEYQQYIDRLEAQSSTYQLLSFYSILLKNCRTNRAIAGFVSSLLSKQLLKPNGVESLIDLALGLREDEQVDIAKLNTIVQVLLTSKPKDLSLIDYYKNIFSQIYGMLVLVNRPLMNTILVEMITVIYKKNKRIVADFLFSDVWNNLNPDLRKDLNVSTDDSIVLTNEVNLNNSFNVCLSISRSLNSSDQEIMNEFFQPIILPLWYYANYQRSKQKDYTIVLNLIKNVIILGDSDYFIDLILTNLIDYQLEWTFDNGENLPYIKFNTKESKTSKENKILELFNKIDFNVETFVNLTSKLNDSDINHTNKILIATLNKLYSNTALADTDIPFKKIIYLKLIQSLLETFKSEIEGSPSSLLIFANTYFNQYFESVKSKSKLDIVKTEDSDDEDEEEVLFDGSGPNGEGEDGITSMVPILEIISTFSLSSNSEKEQMESLQNTLGTNMEYIPKSIHQVCEDIIGIDIKNITVKNIYTGFNMETVLKQINDPTPSVRVYALDKLTNYTINPKSEESKQVSTKYTLNLLLSQLKDLEPFVYLNAIKNVAKVLSFDKSFFSYVVELYSTSKKTIDEKLRMGEILTKFISSHGKVLTGSHIKEVINTCIIISRAESKTKKKSADNDDLRMKMSALSILGTTCHECGYSVIPYITEIADLVHGIITFETSPELKRAAVVIINDIVSSDNGLEIIKDYGEKLQILLDYISGNDHDLLVCQLASATLDQIEESFNSKFTISN